jgi:hypothetical protein
MYKEILMEIENNTGNIYFYSQLLTQVTGFRPQIAKINYVAAGMVKSLQY